MTNACGKAAWLSFDHKDIILVLHKVYWEVRNRQRKRFPACITANVIKNHPHHQPKHLWTFRSSLLYPNIRVDVDRVTTRYFTMQVVHRKLSQQEASLDANLLTFSPLHDKINDFLPTETIECALYVKFRDQELDGPFLCHLLQPTHRPNDLTTCRVVRSSPEQRENPGGQNTVYQLPQCRANANGPKVTRGSRHGFLGQKSEKADIHFSGRSL